MYIYILLFVKCYKRLALSTITAKENMMAKKKKKIQLQNMTMTFWLLWSLHITASGSKLRAPCSNRVLTGLLDSVCTGRWDKEAKWRWHLLPQTVIKRWGVRQAEIPKWLLRCPPHALGCGPSQGLYQDSCSGDHTVIQDSILAD